MARLGRTAAARFRAEPPGVLYPQLFLGIGWLRAAVAHSLDVRWWNGEEVAGFAAGQLPEALPFYRPFLDYVVATMPIAVAVIVIVAQFAIGLALLANHRPVVFALAGAFLNLHFMAAGRVNPSVFYIVLAMAVVLWRPVTDLSVNRSHNLATRSTVLAAGVALLCLPFARTLEPSAIIEDPALVLVCLSVLLAGSAWIVHSQNTEPRLVAVNGAESWSGAGLIGRLDPGGIVAGPASNGDAALVPVDDTPSDLDWYSVRCHFRFDEASYEERITMWQAAGFDEAIALAEVEARRYAVLIDGQYLEWCDCYHLTSAPMAVEQGFEMYSLVRTSDLDPETYLRTFFFTGGERSSMV
jgi:hypothetical protein